VASVWKHPESQYWTACFRDQNGRQRRISTKETNENKALKIAEEFKRAARTKRTLKQFPIFIVNGSAWRVVALIGAEERLR
jgi:hypothetical protein